MATTRRVVHVKPDVYERLADEAARRHEHVDEVAGRILSDHLPASAASDDLGQTLQRLELLRGRMIPGRGAVGRIREGRDELDRRIA
jgi:hypothetical protein